MPALEKNRIYRAHIDGYSSEGLGIARIDGQVVFVHGAVRGETCDVLVMKVLKNAAFGKIAALAEPSPARRQPDCPYYGRCGGCDFRHMSYEEELWAKRARVQDALTRIGGAEVTVEEILGAEQPLHYRNKSIYPISPAGEVGFYRARSHQVVHVEHCLIQKPEADALAQAVRDYIARFQVEPYNEATGRGLLRHLYVRTSCRGESLACLLVNGSRLPHEQELVDMLRAAAPGVCGVVLGENTRRGNAILGDRYRTLWGRDYLTDTLCGLELRLSVPSFYQVNHDQAQRLYEKALEYAGLTGRELAVDLYCGAGTFTLHMTDSYYNMKEKLTDHMYLIHNAEAAMQKAGVTPKIVAIRGGTDGARLSYEGLPCPNLSTGGLNFHSIHEFIPVRSLEKMVEVLRNLVTL